MTNLLSNWFKRLLLLVLVLISIPAAYAQIQIPDQVLDTFDERCAFSGCHAGADAAEGLDLTGDYAFSALVNRPSQAYGSKYLRVRPGDPARSYLVMKLKNTPGIKGERMPKKGAALSAAELSAIEAWIASLPVGAKTDEPQREFKQAFPGLSMATLPTTQMLEKGQFAYRIAHRWLGDIADSGIDQFFGLDAGARIFTQFIFPISENFLFNIGRTGERATYELAGKWRFLRERTDGSVPVSAALIAGIDWASAKGLSAAGQQLDRTDGERFHFFGQLALSKQLAERLSVVLVPGVLLNGNTQIDGESALLTIGFGGKFELIPDFSIFVEGVPIVSGADEADVVGILRNQGNDQVFNDAFTIGLEKRAGGHVFHLYVTNSAALATDQYMSGSDFDFAGGDLRLGFNIYRKLGLP